MNVAFTKRKHPRYRAAVPVAVSGAKDILVTRDISLSGCFFDHPLPDSISNGSHTLQVITDGQPIEISRARILDRKTLGFGFKWNLDPVTSTKLAGFLAKKSREPSADAKAHYLRVEQGKLFEGLLAISDHKEKGYRFLFALTAAYFVVLSAPLHFISITNVEQAAFYAVGGLWASMILIYQSLRFMLWLGIAFRRKALLMHAISANRSWIFANDGSYYSKSVFPLGTTYDRSRVRAPSETYPIPISDQGSTSIFHFLIQALFAFGMILFLSILLRAIQEQGNAFTNGFRLFDARYFASTYSAASILLICWVQFCGNACSHYHQQVWEARRITAERPNPKFTSGALKKDQPWDYSLFTFAMYTIWFYGVLAFLVAVFGSHIPPWIPRHVNYWGTTTAVLVIFLVGKIAYIASQIRAQTNREKMEMVKREIIYSSGIESGDRERELTKK